MSEGKPDITPVRWGIIGMGRIAQWAIAPAIRKSGTGELVALASRQGPRAAAIAEELAVPRHYGSYEALLADPTIEAVYIGLPNGLHREWVVQAARAGKHVLCEKSLAFDLESALAMRAAAHEAGVILAEAFMYRHHPQWRVVLGWLQSDKIGRVRAITARFVSTLADATDHRWSPVLGRGCLYDLTCYTVNVARYLTGEEPTHVTGAADWLAPGVDVGSQVTMTFPSGVIASGLGHFSTHPDQEVAIHGERGRIVIPRPFIPGTESAALRLVTAEGEKVHEVPGADHFAKQIRHFCRCVREGGGLQGPAEDGVANTAVLAAADRSAREGATVALALPV